MIETEAYPTMPRYEDRARQRFRVGDRVRVGPAYNMGGSYRPDGFEGTYYVVGIVSGNPNPDYRLARNPSEDWVAIVHSTRLTRI